MTEFEIEDITETIDKINHIIERLSDVYKTCDYENIYYDIYIDITCDKYFLEVIDAYCYCSVKDFQDIIIRKMLLNDRGQLTNWLNRCIHDIKRRWNANHTERV